MMKKTTFGAVLAFLAVAAGALVGAALYLYRREKELDEYEKLLYTDDYDDDDDMMYEEVKASQPEARPEANEEPAEAAAEDEVKF